ncbi:MAG: hypothetical protein LBV04_08450 [Deferribacteraceae bacterium]|jgi:hypothetical protein|nr:hypothetical protein [Deferribacteraceae bacterium]
MQKLFILFILSAFVLISCAPAVSGVDRYGQERDYNRQQQQADKNFNELDRQ